MEIYPRLDPSVVRALLMEEFEISEEEGEEVIVGCGAMVDFLRACGFPVTLRSLERRIAQSPATNERLGSVTARVISKADLIQWASAIW